MAHEPQPQPQPQPQQPQPAAQQEGARAPAPRRAAWLAAAGPWMLGGAVVLALVLAGLAYDLLQVRLHESTVRFNDTMRRFERCWTLYDASVESTLALKFALAAPTAPPERARLLTDTRRFDLQAAALQGEVEQPGVLMLSQAAGWAASVRALDAALAHLAATPADAPQAVDEALRQAREATQQVLDGLSRVGQEARQRQSVAAGFRDEVDAVRHQVLLAFAGIVAMLLLAVALALQWIVVARRERASRHEAQRQAARAETERRRAEDVARDKARFLGMLSHELLTPLQSIWSTMDVIEARGRIDARDAAFLRLKESTRSLRGRISDLVDFAKMSSGRLETRIRGFQVDKLIDTALRDLEEPLAARNLDVHWEATPDLAQRIWSDPARLRQIIDNLLSNAIKYTERGGLAIHAVLPEGGRTLRLEVSDTGAGMSAQALGRLYDPFYRAPETAAMAEGSGLGLAVVRSLVELMGGRIEVRSRVGQGTAFVVEVPLAAPPENERDEIAGAAPERAVLVVDDSHEARRALAALVRALGCDAYEASNGAMGLAEAQARDYLAIVLDLQMPDLGGVEIAERLRAPGSRHEKTFLILASAHLEFADAAARSGFDACLAKPVERAELAAALDAAQARFKVAGPAPGRSEAA